MKQYAVIGAGNFGKQVLEDLILLDCEVILLDKDPDIIEFFKNSVTAAYIADVINEEIIVKLIPKEIDAVIVDLGDQVESSILLTQYLKNLQIKKIIVKAETDEHGQILSIIGADHIVFPNVEAAKRITPLLVSDLLFHYMPISGDLVMAEIGIPDEIVGMTVIEADIRENQNINVVAYKNKNSDEYSFFSPDYKMNLDDVLLVVGKSEEVIKFCAGSPTAKNKGIGDVFSHLFGFQGRKSRES